MLCKNIAKNFCFVTVLVFIFALASACGFVPSHGAMPANQGTTADAEISKDYGSPRVIATISSNEITESSGLVASRCNKDVLWTHNDSGDEALIYAINLKGEKLGTWKVTGAKNNDWEDMATFKNAAGQCFLYLGDIGNNERFRSEMTVYRVAEPQVSDADKNSGKKNPIATEPADALKFVYPDIRHDAETLMVHPQTGDVYVMTKSLSSASGVYKISATEAFNSDKVVTPERIGDFTVPAIPNGFLTGGEIAPDGKRIIICDYFAAYEITLPENSKNFDDIWKQKPQKIELDERKQGEAVCYSSDEKSIYATSEKRNSPLIEVDRK